MWVMLRGILRKTHTLLPQEEQQSNLENMVVKTENMAITQESACDCFRVYFGWSLTGVVEHTWVCL